MTSTRSSSTNTKTRSATRRLESFRQRFGDGHFYLACHAALPLALTPDLLYSLWANFQRDTHGEAIEIPWIAVADLMLSNLCKEVGNELYEMDSTVRDELLNQLQQDSRFGLERLRELADFVMAYVEQELEHPDIDTRDLAKTQNLRALAYREPNAAAREIALGLTELSLKDKTEWILAALMNSLAEPLAAFQPLLSYMGAMAALARGNLEAATAQMNQAVDANRQVQVEGVNLPVPDAIGSSVLLEYAGPDKGSPAQSGFRSSTVREQPQAFLKAPEPSVPTRHRLTQLLVGSSIACLILAGGLYGYRHWQGNQPEQNTLQQAIELAKQGQWEAAIATLNQIPANSPAAAQSSAYLEAWSIQLLKRAEDYYVKGDVDAALRDTQAIPKNSSIYTQAQTESVTWNKDKQPLDKIKQMLDKACDREGGKRLLKTLKSLGLQKQAEDLIKENEAKCPPRPVEPPVVETSSPPTQSSTSDQASLQQEDVEPVFSEFISGWNMGPYTRQLDLIAKDFTSVSYERNTRKHYGSDYDYASYANLKKALDSEYKKVEVSNEQFIQLSDGGILVKYSQHYDSSHYESWGTNELYFRRKDGKIEIFKEVFYRDKSKRK